VESAQAAKTKAALKAAFDVPAQLQT